MAMPTRSSPRSASTAPAEAGRLILVRRTPRPWPTTWPSTASASPSCGPPRSRRPSGRCLGRTPLFGVERVDDLADWPLTARCPRRDRCGRRAFDPAATWTLFAGGDILLDRGVYETIEVKGKGVDFPFDGGTAEITSRYCCSSLRLGPAADAADRQRRGDARAHRGRGPGHRQLREPGPEQAPLAHEAARSSRPTRRSSTGWRTPASTTSASPTTTSATPGGAASSRPSRTWRSAASPPRVPART